MKNSHKVLYIKQGKISAGIAGIEDKDIITDNKIIKKYINIIKEAKENNKLISKSDYFLIKLDSNDVYYRCSDIILKEDKQYYFVAYMFIIKNKSSGHGFAFIDSIGYPVWTNISEEIEKKFDFETVGITNFIKLTEEEYLKQFKKEDNERVKTDKERDCEI
jgi:hypothetical protein